MSTKNIDVAIPGYITQLLDDASWFSFLFYAFLLETHALESPLQHVTDTLDLADTCDRPSAAF